MSYCDVVDGTDKAGHEPPAEIKASKSSASLEGSSQNVEGAGRFGRLDLRVSVSMDAEDELLGLDRDVQGEGDDWMEEVSIDVRLRSWKGCIPLLWAMVRYPQFMLKKTNFSHW